MSGMSLARTRPSFATGVVVVKPPLVLEASPSLSLEELLVEATAAAASPAAPKAAAPAKAAEGPGLGLGVARSTWLRWLRDRRSPLTRLSTRRRGGVADDPLKMPEAGLSGLLAAL